MSRSENQKLKLLRILEIMFERTGAEEGITVNQLIEALEEYGIKAERKSIYNDFAALEEVGFSVVRLFGNPPAYTLDNRIFELPELKLLTDAVESSRFITSKKSRELIDKIKLFAGRGERGELMRQVFVDDRVRSENAASLYTVDAIHRGINEKLMITFSYFDYDVDKKKVLRHGGKIYRVSPKSLILNDGNYYLVGYDEDEGMLKNFRVDKMVKVKVTDEEISLVADGYKLNPADYSNKVFGMYGGTEELVTLEARERLATVIVERFGTDSLMRKSDFGFTVTLRVMVSPTFFAWAMSFGGDMKIVSPEPVKRDFIALLSQIAKAYE